MAVSVSNRFEALLSDSDGESRPKAVKAKAQPKQPQVIPGFTSASVPGTSAGFRQVEARDRQNERPRVQRRPEQGTGGNYVQRPYGDHSAAVAEGSDHSADGFSEKPRLSRPGGRRPPRGRGGAGAGAPTRRREFDRRSGDPKQPGPRKDGAGAYNWGSNAEIDGAKAIDQEPGAGASGSDEEKPVEQADAAEPGAAEAGEGSRERVEEEEEERIDYEEYQRQQQAKRAQLNLRTIEQARNVDAAELEAEGYERLERKDSEEQRPNSREGRIHIDEEDDGRKPKRYNFFDLARQAGNFGRYGSRGGRGGRGGERGARGARRGGRDAAAGPVTEQQKPKKHVEKVQLDLTNADAFPALN